MFQSRQTYHQRTDLNGTGPYINQGGLNIINGRNISEPDGTRQSGRHIINGQYITELNGIPNSKDSSASRGMWYKGRTLSTYI